jgi:hypothetical protein
MVTEMTTRYGAQLGDEYGVVGRSWKQKSPKMKVYCRVFFHRPWRSKKVIGQV